MSYKLLTVMDIYKSEMLCPTKTGHSKMYKSKLDRDSWSIVMSFFKKCYKCKKYLIANDFSQKQRQKNRLCKECTKKYINKKQKYLEALNRKNSKPVDYYPNRIWAGTVIIIMIFK